MEPSCSSAHKTKCRLWHGRRLGSLGIKNIDLRALCVERNIHPTRKKYTVEGWVEGIMNSVITLRSGSNTHKTKCRPWQGRCRGSLRINNLDLRVFCVERNIEPIRNKYTVERWLEWKIKEVLMERSGSNAHKNRVRHDAVDAWALSKLKIVIFERSVLNATSNPQETNTR